MRRPLLLHEGDIGMGETQEAFSAAQGSFCAADVMYVDRENRSDSTISSCYRVKASSKPRSPNYHNYLVFVSRHEGRESE